VIVLDSSAAVDYLADTAAAEWVTATLLANPEIHAPHLLDVEVLGSLRRLVLTGRLSVMRASAAVEDLGVLAVKRYPHLPFLERVWELRATVTAADAVFVALAEALDAPLVTTDAHLARAPGLRARVLTP
jgi:predicted nucleic acid-binding protein